MRKNNSDKKSETDSEVARRVRTPPKKADPVQVAASKLRLAKQLLASNRTQPARKRLTAIVTDFPQCPAADEARRLLAAN